MYVSNIFLKGSKNKLSVKSSWTCETMCSFDYSWYPFDTQSCGMEHISSTENVRLKIGQITYSGTKDIGKYYFREIKSCEVDKDGKDGIFIDLIFNRSLIGNFMTMFLPTGMLLIISQISTTFSSSFLEMVVEVNTTLLLVLTTL